MYRFDILIKIYDFAYLLHEIDNPLTFLYPPYVTSLLIRLGKIACFGIRLSCCISQFYCDCH